MDVSGAAISAGWPRLGKSQLTPTQVCLRGASIPADQLVPFDPAAHDMVLAVNLGQLPGYFLGSIRRRIIHDDNLPGQAAADQLVGRENPDS